MSRNTVFTDMYVPEYYIYRYIRTKIPYLPIYDHWIYRYIGIRDTMYRIYRYVLSGILYLPINIPYIPINIGIYWYVSIYTSTWYIRVVVCEWMLHVSLYLRVGSACRTTPILKVTPSMLILKQTCKAQYIARMLQHKINRLHLCVNFKVRRRYSSNGYVR